MIIIIMLCINESREASILQRKIHSRLEDNQFLPKHKNEVTNFVNLFAPQ